MALCMHKNRSTLCIAPRIARRVNRQMKIETITHKHKYLLYRTAGGKCRKKEQPTNHKKEQWWAEREKRTSRRRRHRRRIGQRYASADRYRIIYILYKCFIYLFQSYSNNNIYALAHSALLCTIQHIISSFFLSSCSSYYIRINASVVSPSVPLSHRKFRTNEIKQKKIYKNKYML